MNFYTKTMRNWTTFLIMLFTTSTFAAMPSTEKVRELYKKSFKDEKSCSQLIELLKPYNEKNIPLFLGYKGMAHMMMSQYVSSPFSKLSHFNKGKQMLEDAILTDANPIELKFLRFSVQENVPAFLNYHHNLSSDKKFILQQLPHVQDLALKKIILTYFKQSKY